MHKQEHICRIDGLADHGAELFAGFYAIEVIPAGSAGLLLDFPDILLNQGEIPALVTDENPHGCHVNPNSIYTALPASADCP